MGEIIYTSIKYFNSELNLLEASSSIDAVNIMVYNTGSNLRHLGLRWKAMPLVQLLTNLDSACIVGHLAVSVKAEPSRDLNVTPSLCGSTPHLVKPVGWVCCGRVVGDGS